MKIKLEGWRNYVGDAIILAASGLCIILIVCLAVIAVDFTMKTVG